MISRKIFPLIIVSALGLGTLQSLHSAEGVGAYTPQPIIFAGLDFAAGPGSKELFSYAETRNGSFDTYGWNNFNLKHLSVWLTILPFGRFEGFYSLIGISGKIGFDGSGFYVDPKDCAAAQALINCSSDNAKNEPLFIRDYRNFGLTIRKTLVTIETPNLPIKIDLHFGSGWHRSTGAYGDRMNRLFPNTRENLSLDGAYLSIQILCEAFIRPTFGFFGGLGWEIRSATVEFGREGLYNQKNDQVITITGGIFY